MQCQRPTWVLLCVLATVLQSQLPDNSQRKAVKCALTAWASATHVGDLEEVPSPQLHSGPTLVIVPVWRVNQKMEGLSLALILLWNKQNKSFKIFFKIVFN